MNHLTKGCLISVCTLTLIACSESDDDITCGTNGANNPAPGVNIAEQFQVATGGILSATASISDCDTTTVEWQQASGIPLIIESSSNEAIVIKAPTVSQTEETVFSLTVTDSAGQVTSTTFKVFIHPYLLSTTPKQIDIIPQTEQSNSFHFIDIGNVDNDPTSEIFVSQKISGDTASGKISVLKLGQELSIAHEMDIDNGYFGTLGDFLNKGRDQLVLTVNDPDDLDWNGQKWELVDNVLGAQATYPLGFRFFYILEDPSYRSRDLKDLNNNDKDEITFHADLNDDSQACELTLNQQSEIEHECRKVITSTGEFIDGIHDHPGRARIVDLNNDNLPDELETRQALNNDPNSINNPTYTVIKTQSSDFTFVTSNTFPEMEWVTQVGDLTGDDFPELLYEPTGNAIIYKNKGTAALDFERIELTTSLCRSFTASWNGNTFPNSIAEILDMDGDGDKDLLCRYNGRWIENLEVPNLSPHAVAIDMDVAREIRDFDGDGDMDIVGLKTELVDGVDVSIQHVLINNNGFAQSTAFDIDPAAHADRSIYADIDNDGDIDLITQEPNQHGVKVSVFTNISVN